MFGSLSNSINSPATINPIKDFEVSSPPEDSVSSMEFSPATLHQQNFLIAGSWDGSVRCWEVHHTGQTKPISMKSNDGPVLDVCWQDDGSKVYMASTNKQVKCWDLASDAVIQVAQHDGPIKTCHWIKALNYTCLMTGSWDKTLKFWDTRTPTPILSIDLPERCFCADVKYPMAAVGLADRSIILYTLEHRPTELTRHESPFKFQHRAMALFKDTANKPAGYALGSIEGRVAIQYFNPTTPRDNFTFACHRLNDDLRCQNVYAVNDLAFHPVHGTLASVGADGTFSFWDKNSRRKLKSSETMEQAVTKCAFNADGQIFAYAVGYDWTKGHEHNDPQKKPHIYLHPCFEDMKPKAA